MTGRLPEDWPPMSSRAYTQGLAAFRDALNSGQAIGGGWATPRVDGVHLVHSQHCAILPDAEGKAGPCDCGAEP